MKLRRPENSTERQNVHRRRSSSSSASKYIRVNTNEANFHKPRVIRGCVPVWAIEWDVFHCTPCRGGRGRRAAVDMCRGVFVLVFGRISYLHFRFLYFARTRPTASTRQPCHMYLSTSNEARPRERNGQRRFLPIGKNASLF